MKNIKSLIFLFSVFIGVAIVWAVVSTGLDLNFADRFSRTYTISRTQKIYVKDILKSEKFYSELLRWRVEENSDSNYSEIASGPEKILLFQSVKNKFQTIYFNIKNIEQEYNKLKIKYRVSDSISTTSYNTREFSIQDPDSNTLIFMEDIR